MDAPFVHLHVHSEYSLLDGAQRISELAKQAAAMDMPAVALTDHGVMFGVIDFYNACTNVGVKPIIGLEAYVAPGKHTEKTPRSGKQSYHLILLAKNLAGYKNLMKLSTVASLDGFYYKPRIDKELLAAHSEGLIGTSACLGSEINNALINDDYKKALEAADQYRSIFGQDNFYIELQDHGLDEQKKIREPLIKLAKELKLPLVCSNDVHYLTAEHADPHDVLLCIQTGSTVDDPNRLRYGSKEFYFKSPEEMMQLFGDVPEAIAATREIADRCDVKIEFGRLNLPAPELPEDMNPHEYVTKLCEENVPRLYPNATPEVQTRLEYELSVIDQTKFSSYFLIVRDFAQFARKQGIFFGVRGSAAGSLVSYCLGITDIDPLEHGLTFERFLNPERIAMPDIDMDFEDDRREEVIKYVTDKYGQDHVSQIITFGTMAARAAIRDAGRALALPLADVDRAAKAIPALPLGMTIDKALETAPEFAAVYNSSQEIQHLIDTARSIEGNPRNMSIHAAGVVISNDPLVDHVPLSRGSNGEVVTQYHMNALEKIGLLKMDFLGLSNLSVLAKAVNNIKQSHNIVIDVLHIPKDDKKTYAMLSKGDVVGVFQLEGSGMRRYLMELKPQSIQELSAMVALYRPGPLAEIPNYIKGKFKPKTIQYLHPKLEPILKETYGVIVYQDQVLRIVQSISGLSLGQADILRKAMGKKIPEVMEKMRAQLIDGAVKNGVDEKIAIKICDLIEPFTGYAFNKAHATCYGTVAYQTAYLKANYPAEYMAALLAVYRDKEDKVTKSIEECRRLGIAVLPPDINQSGIDFTFEKGKVRFGLCALKGIGESAVEGMLKSRTENGPFTSIFDLCERTRENGSLGKSTIECLVKAGAFDTLHPNRNQLLLGVEAAIAYADRVARDKATGQESLFGGGDETGSLVKHYPPLPEAKELSRTERLAMEKEVLGIYVSDHPLRSIDHQIRRRATASIGILSEYKDNEQVTIGGIITALRTLMTKKSNEKMAIMTLEDMSGAISVTVFPRVLAACTNAVKKDLIVLVKGRVTFRDNNNPSDDSVREAEIRAETIEILEINEDEIEDDNAGLICIQVERATRAQLSEVREALAGNPGDYQVIINVRQNGRTKEFRLKNRAAASEHLESEIKKALCTNAKNTINITHLDPTAQQPDLDTLADEPLIADGE